MTDNQAEGVSPLLGRQGSQRKPNFKQTGFDMAMVDQKAPVQNEVIEASKINLSQEQVNSTLKKLQYSRLLEQKTKELTVKAFDVIKDAPTVENL